MRRIGLIMFCLLYAVNLSADDKLDVLDKQSKEFFKAITGLEKDYLEEQIDNIKNNKTPNVRNTSNSQIINSQPVIVEKKVSQEEYAKNVFEHENEMARLTTDFTRTKKLKDIRIKSMYSFNGKDYVVLKLDKEKKSSKNDQELNLNIEGRYTKGDYILTHKIISINTRTKTVRLYKKLDENYGYSIHLSNYGISVSDLRKEAKTEKKQVKFEKKIIKSSSVKRVFDNVESDPITQNTNKEVDNCLYTVAVSNLNVRNSTDLEATILRILRIDDDFTIVEKRGNWVKLDTIYKKKSGDVMNVSNKKNWVQIIDNNVLANDDSCK